MTTLAFNRKNQTIVLCLLFAVLGSVIAHFTDVLIIVPVLFGAAIPLVNIEKSGIRKLLLITVVVLVNLVIFVLAVLAMLSIVLDDYLLPGVIVGIAGVLILVINGLLSNSIVLNYKSVLITFFLSAVSYPIWTLISRDLFRDFIFNSGFLEQFGGMILWMILTAIGVSTGIQKKL